MAKSSKGTVGKISISMSQQEMVTLKGLAKALHGGNLSATVAEAINLLRKQKAQERLFADLPPVTQEEQAQILAEWNGAEPSTV